MQWLEVASASGTKEQVVPTSRLTGEREPYEAEDPFGRKEADEASARRKSEAQAVRPSPPARSSQLEDEAWPGRTRLCAQREHEPNSAFAELLKGEEIDHGTR